MKSLGATVYILFLGLIGLSISAQAHASPVVLPMPGHLGFVLQNQADANDQLRLYIGNLYRNEPVDLQVEIDRMAGTVDISAAGTAGIYGPNAFLPPHEGPVLPDVIQAEFTLSYTDVTFDIDPVTGRELLGIGRSPAAGTGTVKLTNQNLFGGMVTFDVYDKFFFPDNPNANHPRWGDFGLEPFNLFMGVRPGSSPLPHQTGLAGWLMSDQTLSFGGRTFGIFGDVHGQFPEPGTAVMAVIALAGFCGRRSSRR